MSGAAVTNRTKRNVPVTVFALKPPDASVEFTNAARYPSSPMSKWIDPEFEAAERERAGIDRFGCMPWHELGGSPHLVLAGVQSWFLFDALAPGDSPKRRGASLSPLR